jgi:hypothetical protein
MDRGTEAFAYSPRRTDLSQTMDAPGRTFSHANGFTYCVRPSQLLQTVEAVERGVIERVQSAASRASCLASTGPGAPRWGRSRLPRRPRIRGICGGVAGRARRRAGASAHVRGTIARGLAATRARRIRRPLRGRLCRAGDLGAKFGHRGFDAGEDRLGRRRPFTRLAAAALGPEEKHV